MRHTGILAAALVAIGVASASADITTGLIAWYPFDGNLQDESGFSNDGTAVGGLVSTTDRFGNPNSAYEFNGTSSYVYIPNSLSLSSPDTALTQAAWVMLYGPSQVGQAYGPLIMKSASTENAFMYRMIASPDGISAAFGDWFHGAGTAVTLELNQWYHVATVFDGSSVRCYVNGARVDSVALAASIVPDSRDLTIGADIPGILEIFYGKIDDVHIYSRALSDGDIAELYGGTPSGARGTPAITDFAISRVYPNPTSDRTRIDFHLGAAAPVELTIYDVQGRRVRQLRAGPLAGGAHRAAWDGRDDAGTPVASGVYFARLAVEGRSVSTRVIRIR